MRKEIPNGNLICSQIDDQKIALGETEKQIIENKSGVII
jgi:hypothetical protein